MQSAKWMSFSFRVFKWIEFELNKSFYWDSGAGVKTYCHTEIFRCRVLRFAAARLTRLETKKVETNGEDLSKWFPSSNSPSGDTCFAVNSPTL